eukprot:1159444-Pelagomonas_calceolata.AAC.4
MAALLQKSGLSAPSKVVAQANKAAPRVSQVCRAQQQGAPDVVSVLQRHAGGARQSLLGVWRCAVQLVGLLPTVACTHGSMESSGCTVLLVVMMALAHTANADERKSVLFHDPLFCMGFPDRAGSNSCTSLSFPSKQHWFAASWEWLLAVCSNVWSAAGHNCASRGICPAPAGATTGRTAAPPWASTKGDKMSKLHIASSCCSHHSTSCLLLMEGLQLRLKCPLCDSCSYEDNFDAVNNLYVVEDKSDKSSIEAYGTPEEFISQFGYLLGKQAWAGRCTAVCVVHASFGQKVLVAV